MPDYVIRLLVGCLAVWLIDQILVKFGVSDPPSRIIQILVIIVAVLYIVFGSMLPL